MGHLPANPNDGPTTRCMISAHPKPKGEQLAHWFPSMVISCLSTLLSFAVGLRITVGWWIPYSSVGEGWGSHSISSRFVENRVKLLNSLPGAVNPRYYDGIMVRGGVVTGGEVGSTSGGDNGISSSSSRSSGKFEAAIAANFPGLLLPESEFAEKCASVLIERGFDAGSSISSVSVCRDEVRARALVEWGKVAMEVLGEGSTNKEGGRRRL